MEVDLYCPHHGDGAPRMNLHGFFFKDAELTFEICCKECGYCLGGLVDLKQEVEFDYWREIEQINKRKTKQDYIQIRDSLDIAEWMNLDDAIQEAVKRYKQAEA